MAVEFYYWSEQNENIFESIPQSVGENECGHIRTRRQKKLPCLVHGSSNAVQTEILLQMIGGFEQRSRAKSGGALRRLQNDVCSCNVDNQDANDEAGCRDFNMPDGLVALRLWDVYTYYQNLVNCDIWRREEFFSTDVRNKLWEILGECLTHFDYARYIFLQRLRNVFSRATEDYIRLSIKRISHRLLQAKICDEILESYSPNPIDWLENQVLAPSADT